MTEGISVVIPNYNGSHLLAQTLPTVLLALVQSSKQYEVIVVDDCSTDDSVPYLQCNYPLIKIIKNSKNSGFSVTANAGIFSALYNKVLLLNSDVKLEVDYFDRQLTYFNNPNTFGVMGRIIGWDDEHIQDAAKYPKMQGSKIKTNGNYYLKNEDDMKDGIFTTYLSGANALFDTKKFKQIGGFDELFSPFYAEDTELSLRAWRLGWTCYYDHFSVCRHKTSATISTSQRKNFVNCIYDRNKMYLHAIHLQGWQKALWLLQLIPETFLRLITFRWHYLKSVYIFATTQKKIALSRQRFKALSKTYSNNLTVKEVYAKILKPIENKEIVVWKN